MLMAAAAEILPALLAVQQLDVLDVEAIHPLYQELTRTSPHQAATVSSTSQQPDDRLSLRTQSISQGTSTAATATATATAATNSSSSSAALSEAGCSMAAPVPSRREALATLRDYLTASTAKDCCIMVTLQRVQPVHHPGCAGAASTTDQHTAISHSQHTPPRQHHTDLLSVGDVQEQGGGSSTAGDQDRERGAQLSRGAAGGGGVGVSSGRIERSGGVRLLHCGQSGEVYAYNLAFVDLDIKPSRKVASHLALDQNIQRFIRAHLSHPLLS
ncbi:MAG: hypothetical protein WDW38_007021 [Sanguina aurantia]